MKRRVLALVLAMMTAALLAGAGRARAGDGSLDTRIEIRAPLEAAACDRTPQTIRVLGLPIDVTGARFGVEEEGGPGEDATAQDVDGSATCASLVVRRPVTVRLGGDVAPLSAAEVVQGSDEQEIAIRAPIQAVSRDLQTITLLGLPIDASTVRFATSDGEDGGLNDPGLDPAKRLVGRLVQADLDPGSLPSLVAAGVEVMTLPGGNEVEAERAEDGAIEDEDGRLIPAERVTVFEFGEVFLPALMGKAPRRSLRPHTPHAHTPRPGRMAPGSLPPATVRAPVMRMRAAPGFE